MHVQPLPAAAGTRLAVVTLFAVLAVLPIVAATPAAGTDVFEKVTSPADIYREMPPDARSLAMGGAMTALADGASAAYWNPGALAVIGPRLQTAYSTREILTDFQERSRVHSLSATGKWRALGAGAHFTFLDDQTPFRTVTGLSEDTLEFEDYAGIVGAGIDLTRMWPGASDRLLWGIGGSAVFYRKGVGDETDSAMDADLGTLLAWRIPVVRTPAAGAGDIDVRVGYVVRNLFESEMTIGELELPLGRRDRVGLAVTGGFIESPAFGTMLRGAISVERRGLLITATDGEDAVDQVGAELTLAGIVTGRAGVVLDGNGDGDDRASWGVGVGFQPLNRFVPWLGVQLDYGEADMPAGIADVEQWSLSAWLAL